MDENSRIVYVVFIALVLGFIMGLLFGELGMKQDAIKKGFAEYNQTTGKWQWKEASDERK